LSHDVQKCILINDYWWLLHEQQIYKLYWMNTGDCCTNNRFTSFIEWILVTAARTTDLQALLNEYWWLLYEQQIFGIVCYITTMFVSFTGQIRTTEQLVRCNYLYRCFTSIIIMWCCRFLGRISCQGDWWLIITSKRPCSWYRLCLCFYDT
jgi:hypothetical protein